MTLELPTVTESSRLAQAMIQKATRFLVMAQAPLGLWGDATEFGQATVRPDYQIRELLFGFHTTLEVTATDLAALVTADDVIRAGLGVDPTTFPTARIPDVEQAIEAAASWVYDEITKAWGVA